MRAPFAALAALITFGCIDATHARPSLVTEQPPEATVAAAAGPDAGRDCSATTPPDDDTHYGVYVNGHKVGWMRSTQARGEARFVTTTEMHASVGGLGRVSSVELREERTYDTRTQALLGLRFFQGAQTGRVEVVGQAQHGELELAVTAGAATQKQRVPVRETLADAVQLWSLACRGAGGSVTVHRFDPSVLKNLEIRYTVAHREERLFGGVKTAVLRIETEYPELGVKESSWVDGLGRLLETQVGGFFVARIEPPEVAKRLDYSQDILVSAVVKTPAPIAAPESLARLRLTFEGFGEQLPPSSPRQKVARRGARVELSLARDPVPGSAPLGDAPHEPETEPTPFIQSDAPAIRAAAREAIGDAHDAWTAVSRLVPWVFTTIRDEYVPSYSNALEALTSRRGDCTEHAVLFVALARALGIPARVAVGIAYWPPGGGFGWHAWAEVRIGQRWVAVDPTWNQSIADATHVKLAAGDPAEQTRIVMLLGRLTIVDQQF